MNKVENRSEIVFLYDIKDANPNGDPMDDNKPRIDEETEINIVTDVRLKRTIRDYLHDFKHKEIFIIKAVNDNGTQKTRKERLKEHGIDKKADMKQLLDKYTDLRLFGATIAVEGKSTNWIGPVQFKFGRSLHKVDPQVVKGTSVMPSGEDKGTGTFIQTQILYYSLICFYGIINENAAKETNLTEDDINLLLDGIWNGTKNLITRSKIGQTPRFLLRVIYNKDNYHIGNLDKGIKLVYAKDDRDVTDGKEIRGISELKIDISDLIKTISQNKEKIKKIEFEVGPSVVFMVNKEAIDGSSIKEVFIKNEIKSEQIEHLNLDKE